ncbi:MAG: heme NO-binding domain-containing protein, partial [Pirellulales bacterium]|nr:heme NO-binding domain-containing protein [Pirellulales bacterium]
MHGLIFFYIRTFADTVSSDTASWSVLRSTVATSHEKYLPSGTYPDSEAIHLLESLAASANEPLPSVIEKFGMFLAPQLLKVAGQYIDPDWSALDLIEHTESIMHSMIRSTNP